MLCHLLHLGSGCADSRKSVGLSSSKAVPLNEVTLSVSGKNIVSHGAKATAITLSFAQSDEDNAWKRHAAKARAKQFNHQQMCPGKAKQSTHSQGRVFMQEEALVSIFADRLLVIHADPLLQRLCSPVCLHLLDLQHRWLATGLKLNQMVIIGSTVEFYYYYCCCCYHDDDEDDDSHHHHHHHHQLPTTTAAVAAADNHNSF
jgi:hypothetical protein